MRVSSKALAVALAIGVAFGPASWLRGFQYAPSTDERGRTDGGSSIAVATQTHVAFVARHEDVKGDWADRRGSTPALLAMNAPAASDSSPAPCRLARAGHDRSFDIISRSLLLLHCLLIV
jgi:hypothetical protein